MLSRNTPIAVFHCDLKNNVAYLNNKVRMSAVTLCTRLSWQLVAQVLQSIHFLHKCKALYPGLLGTVFHQEIL